MKSGIQQVVVFDARIYPEANQIISGSRLVLLPFRHLPKSVLLFFGNLTPEPLLFEAEIVECYVGSPLSLLRLAESEHRSVHQLLPVDVKDASAMLIEFHTKLIPMSLEDIVATSYADGQLPLPE